VINIGIRLAILFWVIESAVEAFIFHKSSFASQLLFPVDGHWIWERGAVLLILAALTYYSNSNISKLKQAEEELRKSEEKFRAVFESAPIGIGLSDTHGRPVDFNPAIQKILGYNAAELQKTHFAAFTHPDDVNQDLKLSKELIAGRIDHYQIDKRYIRKDGQLVWGRLNVSLVRSREGVPQFSIVIVEDVTERKSSEEAIQEGERRYRLITENVSDVIWTMDMNLRFTFVSPSVTRLLGYTVEEAKAPFETLLTPSSFELVMNVLKEELAAENPANADPFRSRTVELNYIRKDKTVIWIEVTMTFVRDQGGRPIGILGVTRDIGERKRVQEAFKKKSEEQALLLDNIDTLVWYLEDTATYGLVNKALAEFLGMEKEDLEYKNVSECLRKEEAEICISGNRIVFEQKRQIHTEEWLKNGHGELRVLSITRTPKLNSSGDVEYVVCSAEDITERKRAEEQLKYLSLFDPLTRLYNRNYFEQEMKRLGAGRSDPVAVVVCDVDGLKLVNDTLGHSTGDMFLSTAADLIKECFRKDDVVARIGGDEFAVLLPNSDGQVVQDACKRVRSAIERYNNENPDLPLSISIGFAVSGKTSEPLDDVFKEADNNMYREKLFQSRSACSAIVLTLMKTLEARDFITEGHAERLEALVCCLSRAAGVPEHRETRLRLLAQFHDIGKVGIPDRILLKPGKLTPEETLEMQRHCEIGHRIALSAPDLVHIADLILKHHEWWNGKGYPLGLKEKGIPLESRILAIADAFDAMTSDRPYRKAMTRSEALAEIKRCAGSQFDPILADIFCECGCGNSEMGNQGSDSTAVQLQ